MSDRYVHLEANERLDSTQKLRQCRNHAGVWLSSVVALIALGACAQPELEQATQGEPINGEADYQAPGTGTRAKGEEGSMGSQSSGKDSRRYAVQGPRDAPEPEQSRRQAVEMAESFGMIGLSGSGTGGGGLGFGSGHGRLGGLPFQSAQPEFNTENYAHISENGFLSVANAPLSTFSADVDTASYTNVRLRLKQGQKPAIDSVRVEELVNFFDYDYGAPQAGVPFGVHAEVSECPWNDKARLVHLGLRTESIDLSQAPAKNLVFLVDVSGSMQPANKLPLLKRGLSLLAQTLQPRDRVSLVAYAGASGVVLPPTPGSDRGTITAALERLESGGSTNGGAGVQLAYQLARSQFIKGGINRVVLATDGDFNVGTTSHGDLVRLIEQERKSGVFLTVLGFGTGNLKDSTMETLADRGNGNYAYIDSLQEARRALVQEAGATLVTVAKDVKFQVEFNPKWVSSYRLIGYENRKLQARDFNDDAKDAGEIGAGHSVTALYEILPRAVPTPGPSVDALKYQQSQLSEAADSDEILTLKLRYKAPTGERSQLRIYPVRDAGSTLAQASDNLRFSAAVAEFGMLLRDSKFKGTSSWAQAQALAQGAIGTDSNGKRAEFVGLVDRARALN